MIAAKRVLRYLKQTKDLDPKTSWVTPTPIGQETYRTEDRPQEMCFCLEEVRLPDPVGSRAW